jgi:hypothetical protein
MVAACSTESASPIAHPFDPCVPLHIVDPDATPAQHAALEIAIASWHAVGLMAPGDLGDESLTVTFATGAPELFGFYDDVARKIYVNVHLTDAQTAVVAAHELGHAFGLVHIPIAERGSVMNAGNLTIVPTGDDDGAIVAMWGACQE